MDPMKLMILGGQGQLGQDCNKVLCETHDVLSVDLEELDITDRYQVETVITGFAPDFIVNCAAYTAVDDCETRCDLASKVNAEGPANLAMTAGRLGSRLVHISTDYVFDGRKPVPEPYTERDEAHPVSCYGRAKLEGESAIKGSMDNYIILRTAWLYGLRGGNFLKTMLRLALEDPRGR